MAKQSHKILLLRACYSYRYTVGTAYTSVNLFLYQFNSSLTQPHYCVYANPFTNLLLKCSEHTSPSAKYCTLKGTLLLNMTFFCFFNGYIESYSKCSGSGLFIVFATLIISLFSQCDDLQSLNTILKNCRHHFITSQCSVVLCFSHHHYYLKLGESLDIMPTSLLHQSCYRRQGPWLYLMAINIRSC